MARYCTRMPRESKEAKGRRAGLIVDALEKEMPEAKIALEYQDELQLLVSVMLSAQTTDALVNQVTPALFAKYRTAQDYARASIPELERMIRRIGLYRGKARNVRAAMQRIAARMVRERMAPGSIGVEEIEREIAQFV